jgi:hypothetical protein
MLTIVAWVEDWRVRETPLNGDTDGRRKRFGKLGGVATTVVNVFSAVRKNGIVPGRVDVSGGSLIATKIHQLQGNIFVGHSRTNCWRRSRMGRRLVMIALLMRIGRKVGRCSMRNADVTDRIWSGQLWNLSCWAKRGSISVLWARWWVKRDILDMTLEVFIGQDGFNIRQKKT